MVKVAFFVEGQTEQIVLQEILQSFFDRNSVKIVNYSFSGGRTGARVFVLKDQTTDHIENKFYFTVYSSNTDNRVASDLRDRYQTLITQNFTHIIAIRDVYSQFKYHEISDLRRNLGYGIKTKPINPIFILGVMEVESWLISEYSFFSKINQKLDYQYLTTLLNFDLENGNIEMLNRPSEIIEKVYADIGREYDKSKDTVEEICKNISFESLYLEKRKKFIDLDTLYSQLELILKEGS